VYGMWTSLEGELRKSKEEWKGEIESMLWIGGYFVCLALWFSVEYGIHNLWNGVSGGALQDSAGSCSFWKSRSNISTCRIAVQLFGGLPELSIEVMPDAFHLQIIISR